MVYVPPPNAVCSGPEVQRSQTVSVLPSPRVSRPDRLVFSPNQRRYALFPESSRGERTLLHIYTTPIGATQVVDLLCSVTNESRRGRPTSRLPDAVMGEREPHVSAITFNRTLQY